MKRLAADLELSEALIIQSMYIFKHAQIGGVVDVHQDSTFLYTEPGHASDFGSLSKTRRRKRLSVG